jgi:two-component system, OmpR family, alkaline phosphatase synthesis response regulator PhoP
LNLPRVNGYGVLKAIRDRGSTVPVLILSAQQEETAKIRGFRLGADDFVTKPFSVLELMARVEALLRRVSTARAEAAHADREEQQVRFGDVEVDLTAQVVFRRGEKVELSPRAFELMVALLDHKGAVVRREKLLRDVWGHRNTVTTRTVDAHVLELRHKLEVDPAHPKHFITVRKAGYRFEW